MEFKFDERHEALIVEVAEAWGVDAKKLKELYVEIMAVNFEDELGAIANENREELR